MEANQRAQSALKAQLGAEEKFRQQTENLKQPSEKLEEAKKTEYNSSSTTNARNQTFKME